ncbi:MAG: phosphatidate cytidylyltransferase, partial [Lautropia sp.]|nr:phosphatidate cytidylyltransferase [Lautropia sp.]
IYAPAWVWGVLSLALMAAAGWEWGMLTGHGPQSRRQAWLVAAPIAVAGLIYLAWRGAAGPAPAWVTVLLALNLLLWFAFALPGVLAARLRGAGGLPAAAFGIVALLCLWIAIYELRLAHPGLVFSAMSIVWCADIGAYFFGRKFGRRKLAVLVSPGKSWEGAIGGLLTVLLVAALAWWLLPQAPVLSSVLAVKAGLLVAAVGLTLIVALSVLGDLFESLLKRNKGVKDSGSLLPGHGGVLDRIDALIPTMPACLLLWAVLTR